MSQRKLIVGTCDLCGAEGDTGQGWFNVPKRTVTAKAFSPYYTGQRIFHVAADVCPACLKRPIADVRELLANMWAQATAQVEAAEREYDKRHAEARERERQLAEQAWARAQASERPHPGRGPAPATKWLAESASLEQGDLRGLGLATRVVNALRGAGIQTLAELAERSPDEIAEIRSKMREVLGEQEAAAPAEADGSP